MSNMTHLPKIKCISYNINGKNKSETEINAMATNITNMLKLYDADIILLQETHTLWNDHWRIKSAASPHSIILESTTAKRRKWGVAILIKEQLKKNIIDVKRAETERGRAMAIMLLFNGHITTIINVYLPTSPSNGSNDKKSTKIEKEINKWINTIDRRHHDIIFGGDINCDLNCHTTPRARRIRKMFEEYNIIPADLRGIATHDRGNTLDIIGTSIKGTSYATADVLMNTTEKPITVRSDHKPLFLEYETLQDESPISSPRIKLNETDQALLQHLLQKELTNSFTLYDFQTKTKEIINTFIKKFSHQGAKIDQAFLSAPIIKSYNDVNSLVILKDKIKKNEEEPTHDTIQRVSETSRSLNIHVHDSINSKQGCRSAIGKCIHILETRRRHLFNQLKCVYREQSDLDTKSQTKDEWLKIKRPRKGFHIRKLRNELGAITTEPEQIREIITRFFEKKLNGQELPRIPDKIKDLLKKTSNNWGPKNLKNFYRRITEWELFCVLKRANGCTGTDNITLAILKNLDNKLLKLLANAFTRILVGIDQMEGPLKTAYISMIPKTLNAVELLELKNFRPITVLSTLYRTYMNLINDRLMNALMETKGLSEL
jgi:endonuclease/exonuclease/phosphatase (EEP) superfamily protein YafD